MSAETTAKAMDVDNTREGRWKCAVCGSMGPNPEYDSLEDHAKDKHPDKWDEFTDATGMGEDVPIKAIAGAIGLAIATSVAVFAATWSLALSILGYVFVACLAYAILWVVGYA